MRNSFKNFPDDKGHFETFGGRYEPVPRVTSFPNMGYKSMYTSGPISIKSTCAHHLQNIV